MATKEKNRHAGPFQDPFWDGYYRKFLRQAGNPDTAEDLTQELRLKVVVWQANNGQPRSFPALVGASYGSVLTDHWRSWFRKGGPVTGHLDEARDQAVSEPLPEEAVWKEELYARVRQRLEELLPADGTLLHAAILQHDVPAAELAKQLGTTPEAIRTYRYKARQLLAQDPVLRALWQELVEEDQDGEDQNDEPGDDEADDE